MGRGATGLRGSRGFSRFNVPSEEKIPQIHDTRFIIITLASRGGMEYIEIHIYTAVQNMVIQNSAKNIVKVCNIFTFVERFRSGTLM